jgi:hypothetical protein
MANKRSLAPPSPPCPQTSLPRLRRCRGGQLRKRHIAVLCFEPSATHMLEALKEFAPKGSRVTLVSKWAGARAGARGTRSWGLERDK